MMPELKGQQVRIRVKNPELFSKFRTDDVGSKGRLQRVAGFRDGVWDTQSWRLNLSDYRGVDDVLADLRSIKGLSPSVRVRVVKLAKAYFISRIN